MIFSYILITKSKFVRCKKLTTCSVLHEEFIIRNPLQFVNLRTEPDGGGGGGNSSSSSSSSSSRSNRVDGGGGSSSSSSGASGGGSSSTTSSSSISSSSSSCDVGGNTCISDRKII